MADKIKDLIKTIPEVEPRWPVERIITQTLKRQLIRLWEKRLAVVSGICVLVLSFLTAVQISKLSKMLDTSGFWTMLSTDRVWLLDEPTVVLQALLEANPWQEVIYLLFLLAVLGYCLYTLLQKMSGGKNLLTIGFLFVLITAAVAIRLWLWPSPPDSSTSLPPHSFVYSEATPTSAETDETRKALGESRPQAGFFLEVFSPEGGAVVKEPWVMVSGRTTPDGEVFVNDKQVYPDKNGSFSIKVDLEEGENPILIVAGNEVGDREIERLVYYEIE